MTKILSVVNCMDSSASMAGKKLEDAKEAMNAFNNSLNLDAAEIAVVVFGPEGRAKVTTNFTDNLTDLVKGIRSFAAENGTPFLPALMQAHNLLKMKQTNKVIVIASDGQPNEKTSDILSYGKKVKSEGIRIVTVAIGSDADKAFLKSLASSEDDFHYSKFSGDLTKTYKQIAKGLVIARK